MIILLSLLVCLIGLLMYALATNGKLVSIGFAMFEVGLLAFLLQDSQLITMFNRQ